MKTLYPFTPEEHAFAEEYHDLVYKFLSIKKLPPVDFYDVVVFGFLEAVQTNHYHPVDPEKQNFKAFAFCCMESALRENWRFECALKRNGRPLSLDTNMDAVEGDHSFCEILSDENQDLERKIENQDLIARLLKVATPREREAIDLVCQGYEPIEVSKIMGVAPETGRRTLYQFRLKAKAVREEREVKSSAQIYRARKKERALQTVV